jgi:hypothetical protein
MNYSCRVPAAYSGIYSTEVLIILLYALIMNSNLALTNLIAQ